MTTGADRRQRRRNDGLWRALEDRGVPACIIDASTVLLQVNQPAADLLHQEPHTMMGHEFAVALGSDDHRQLAAAVEHLATSSSGVTELITSASNEDGGRFDLVMSLTEGPEPGLLTCILEDLTPRRRRELHRRRVNLNMVRRATTDVLTGLVNRQQLLDELESALRRAGRTGGSFCFLYCDLDGFKGVNDELGHQAGDRVLQVAAERLRKATRAEDTVGRLGGDEFCVIADDMTHVDIEVVTRRIVKSVKEPIVLEGGTVELGISIGVAVSDGSQSVREIMEVADERMYLDKRANRLSRHSPPSEAR